MPQFRSGWTQEIIKESRDALRDFTRDACQTRHELTEIRAQSRKAIAESRALKIAADAVGARR
jgi:hypothetical protein